jgi:hypothetical protein
VWSIADASSVLAFPSTSARAAIPASDSRACRPARRRLVKRSAACPSLTPAAPPTNLFAISVTDCSPAEAPRAVVNSGSKCTFPNSRLPPFFSLSCTTSCLSRQYVLNTAAAAGGMGNTGSLTRSLSVRRHFLRNTVIAIASGLYSATSR